MPSILIGNPAASGPQILISGNPWSGTILPVGGIQLRLSRYASGAVFIGLSGGMTQTSGSFYLSGGGLLDGVEMGPGDSYFIPRLATGLSGTIAIHAWHEAAVSGQARLFYEIF